MAKCGRREAKSGGDDDCGCSWRRPRTPSRGVARQEVNGRIIGGANSIGRLRRRRASLLNGPVSSGTLLIMISLMIITMMCTWERAGARITTATATSGKPPLDDDDLIEGRLDSSRLCGTRWPAGHLNTGALSLMQQRRHQTNSTLDGDALDNTDEDKDTNANTNTNSNSNSNSDSSSSSSSNWNSNSSSNSSDFTASLPNDNLLYIVGGDEVDDEQLWPWSVAIYELDPLNGQRSFICSGSLISEKYVLTAAHCIQQSRFDILTPDEIFLKIASIRLDDERADFYRVERIHIHPNYMVDRKTNDIALLRLSRHNQRLPQRARPICLPSSVANRIDFTDQEVTIIGWGKTSAMQGNEPSRLIDIGRSAPAPANPDHSRLRKNASRPIESPDDRLERHASAEDQTGAQIDDTLLQARVRVTSTDQCNKDYSKLEISWLQIDEHFLCASDPQGKRDACQGDSGGPLMWNDNNLYGNRRGRRRISDSRQPGQEEAHEKWYQLGLVSFGYGCANRQYPGVYTRISYYMPWILKTVNERDVVVTGASGGHMLSTVINHNHHKQQLGQANSSLRPAAKTTARTTTPTLHHQGRN